MSTCVNKSGGVRQACLFTAILLSLSTSQLAESWDTNSATVLIDGLVAQLYRRPGFSGGILVHKPVPRMSRPLLRPSP